MCTIKSSSVQSVVEIRMLVASVDCRGARWLAIGLPTVGNALALALEDIDWEAGCLNVRGKGGHRSALPLTFSLTTSPARRPQP
jgi:hypothetical protein